MTNLNSRAFTAKGRIPLFYIASCKPGRKPGRKQVESLSKSQLQTCLKLFFLHSIYLARARTSEPAAVSDQVFDKKVESMSQTRTNLSKTWLQTWSKTRFAARFAAG